MRGGGGQTERRAPQESRGNSSVNEGTLSQATPTGRVEGLKNIAGGAVSFAPPTHTQANYHQPHRSGGGVQTCIGPLDRKPGEDFGRPSAGWLNTSDGRTIKEETLLEGGG